MSVLVGDLRDVLPAFPPASFDAVVCDPPYELGFMGKSWDAAGVSFQPETWEHVLRVLKPGGHLLAFGGTRTYHRIAVAVEDAGFEIRDCLCWLYGSGFPKSLDVSKAIDKAKGVEGGYGDPKTAAIDRGRMRGGEGHEGYQRPWMEDEQAVDRNARAYLPASEEARGWRGWGTALKPAFEPVVVARKPLSERNVAANILRHGAGAINVDGCRVGYADQDDQASAIPAGRATGKSGALAGGTQNENDRAEFVADNSRGRWPANLVLGHAEGCVLVGTREVRGDGNWSGATESVGYEGGWDTSDHPRDRRVAALETVEAWECVRDCPVRMLDEQTGDLHSQDPATRVGSVADGIFGRRTPSANYGDAGGASRFFYVAKASRAERNAGLDHLPASTDHKTTGRGLSNCLGSCPEHGAGLPSGANVYACGCAKVYVGEGSLATYRNHHPTVKPIALMRWLARLVTPLGGVVLDPFAGSGTTGAACALEGIAFVGVELDPEYAAIADARIGFWAEHGDDGLRICAERDAAGRARREREDEGQLALEMP